MGNEATMTCFVCPVKKECREYRKATNSQYGIWAGTWYGANTT